MSVVGLEEFPEEGGSVFAEFAIVGAEGGQEVGIDVEFARDFAVNEDRNHNLGSGFQGASEIAGVRGNIIDNQRFSAGGGRAANALVQRDTRVGCHSALKRAQDKYVVIAFFFEHVKTDPVVTREFLMEERNNTLHEQITRSGFGG